MEAIATDSLLIQRVRQTKELADLAPSGMKRGIEAGDLRQVRIVLKRCLNGRQIVRLVQRCQGL